jgi:prolyl oligopeptidase
MPCRDSFPTDPFRSPRGAPLLYLLAALLILPGWAHETKAQSKPTTRAGDVKETIHGVEVADPYRWLEDQQSPETRAWIDAQNKYTRSLLDSWPGRDVLTRRLTQLIKIDTIGVPTERNGRYFFKKRLADQDQGVLCLRKRTDGPDEVLVDPNVLSPDHSISASLADVSQDGTVVAYELRQGGEDEASIHFLAADTRAELPDRFPKARYESISLTPDKRACYYSRHQTDGPRVYYHVMGTDPARDREVFGKGYGPDKIIEVNVSEDGHYLILTVSYGAAADRSEIYFQDLAEKGPLTPLVNDLAARFLGQAGGDQVFLHTNWKAPKSRILAVDLKNPARERWREIVPERDAVIDSFSLAGGKVFVNYTRNASTEVQVFNPTGEHVRDLALPSIGSVSEVSGRWTNKEAFYGFTSFTVPLTIYRYDAETGNQSVWARLKVRIDSQKFEVKQVWYESKEKTLVPMFLVHLKGIKLDGSNPTLLTGYGGFNISETPDFSNAAAVWAENGGVFAEANLRGGGEFGEVWHQAGMLDKKQNVFDDFIAAGEWLIQNGYTKPSRLAIRGGSNGGLLVGAALTQRPDLFRAVVCAYPLLDMLRYHKFLVARYWVPEYGSSDDPAQFKYIYAYSPYHHVKPGTTYPAVLFVSGDSDTRVAPLHARKMTALVQAATGSDRPVLLRYDTEAGHTVGGMPATKQIAEATDWLGFLFWQLGVPLGGTSP